MTLKGKEEKWTPQQYAIHKATKGGEIKFSFIRKFGIKKKI